MLLFCSFFAGRFSAFGFLPGADGLRAAFAFAPRSPSDLKPDPLVRFEEQQAEEGNASGRVLKYTAGGELSPFAALTTGCFRDMLSVVQTTIQLDDAVLAQATQLAKSKGRDLSQFIEETLRDKIAPKPSVPRQPFFCLTTVGGQGIRPGVDLNHSAALLSLMEQGA